MTEAKKTKQVKEVKPKFDKEEVNRLIMVVEDYLNGHYRMDVEDYNDIVIFLKSIL